MQIRKAFLISGPDFSDWEIAAIDPPLNPQFGAFTRLTRSAAALDLVLADNFLVNVW
jgi:hypothetical protein